MCLFCKKVNGGPLLNRLNKPVDLYLHCPHKLIRGKGYFLLFELTASKHTAKYGRHDVATTSDDVVCSLGTCIDNSRESTTGN